MAFDPEALYTRLDSERRTRRLSWRGLCKEANVHPAATSRLAYGHNPNVNNLARLLLWLGDTDLKPYIAKEPGQ